MQLACFLGKSVTQMHGKWGFNMVDMDWVPTCPISCQGRRISDSRGGSEGSQLVGQSSDLVEIGPGPGAKKAHVDKLTSIKRLTLAIITAADLILVAALLVQLLALSSSLSTAFAQKTTDTSSFVHFRYNAFYRDMGMAALQHATNSSNSIVCQAVFSNRSAVSEQLRRLAHEQDNRRNELSLIVRLNGSVIINARSQNPNNQIFNPENVISIYAKKFSDSMQSVSTSVLLNPAFLLTMNASVYSSSSFPDKSLTWSQSPSILFQLLLIPIPCGTGKAQALLVYGQAVTQNRYTLISDVVTHNDKSSFASIVSADNQLWLTSCSYGKGPGLESFPDIANLLDKEQLNKALDSGQDRSVTGAVHIGNAKYTYSAKKCPQALLQNGTIISNLIRPKAVCIYGEENGVVSKTVKNAIAWHAPCAVILIVLSLVMVRYAFRKFIDPMRALIESVKLRRLKQFNDSIRTMKSNRSWLWILLSKAVLVQCALIGLIFINRALLLSVISSFTSAITEGRFMDIVLNSKSDNVMSFIEDWSSFDIIVQRTAQNQILPSSYATRFKSVANSLQVSGILITDTTGIILASSYPKSNGHIFQIQSALEYLANQSQLHGSTFAATELWSYDQVGYLTGVQLPSNEPGLVRIVASSIDSTFDDRRLMVGAMVVVDMFNEKISVWDDVLKTFNDGYYGVFLWDKNARNFRLVTSALKRSGRVRYDVDIDPDGRDVLNRGLSSSYTHSGIYEERNVIILGDSYSVSVAPVADRGEISFNEYVVNAYIVRGVSEAPWSALLSTQLILQVTILIVQLLMSTIKITLTYIPMRNFLISFEKAVHVPSMSEKDRKRLNRQAAQFVNGNLI